MGVCPLLSVSLALYIGANNIILHEVVNSRCRAAWLASVSQHIAREEGEDGRQRKAQGPHAEKETEEIKGPSK